ncbi:uncharacterized protein LOC114311591 [Camellia sinensis]|uniref:uncharacterized protein LOC114311591 n=1 Tax=Camellia sinensis TaxID=4442 RepID=UPI001036F2DD|nr:uncharacterized protein LOC114311591 [Camellia sinensis]
MSLLDQTGQSLVSVFYNFISTVHGTCNHPIHLVWNKQLPPKVQFFSWLAWKYKLKTSVFLQRIGILDGSASTLCIFCQEQQETAEHVLISCHLVWKVWTGLLQWWGTTWVVPNSVSNLLLWWSGFDCRKSERRIWNAIPLVTLWSIWKHRNECLFQASSPNLQELQELIVTRIAIWLKAASTKLHFSINDFLYNISAIRHCINEG